MIRGGGWSPNLFLHYSAADTAKQIALMKNMGVNAIRLEGHIMPNDWFEQMDEAGILVNGGFQCCDAWAVGKKLSTAQQSILENSALRERDIRPRLGFLLGKDTSRPLRVVVGREKFGWQGWGN